VPVFSRRKWQSARLLAAALVLAPAGAWLAFAGRALDVEALDVAGAVTSLAAGLAFIVSVVRLFRSPAGAVVGPPLPYPGQAAIDRVGIAFTRLAGIYLLFGLLAGVFVSLWEPTRGRWDLVWAHALLLGWFLQMASGVIYHVLPRWTGRPWRTPRLIVAHLRLNQLALPAMLAGLALDLDTLFTAGGATMAVALLLLVVNIAPLASALPPLPRAGVTAAGLSLLAGITLGTIFAFDPAVGARLRQSHALLNLFGWTSLLVSGVGYYLFPNFAGRPLRWPRLAAGQLALLATGVLLGAAGWWWRSEGGSADGLILVGGALIGVSLLLFATIVAATFRRAGHGTMARVALAKPASIRR
jgi:hypothetical protein